MKKAKDNKKIEDKREIAIKVDGISKTFRIPHEKHTSLKSAALNAFEKKTYEEFVALKDISFEVKKGEFFGIIGRNGSGKSTLLKILAGIYMADEGKVVINGKLSPFLELGVGFNPELTGRENLFLGGSILGLARKEIAEKFDKIVNFSEIGEFIDMKMKNYSSGMQVRLAFSLAINAHAEILLMDEVLAVGDSNFQVKCIDEFNKYRNQGKTVILVTHDIGTIQRYCDRAILLRNGKVQLIDDANKVGAAYLNQNIDDMEETSTKEKKEKSHIKKDGPRITKVEFLTENNKSQKIFKTGDDVKIRLYFNGVRQKDLNFGLALVSSDNNYIFGINTFTDKVDMTKYKQQGYFEVLYKNIPLRSNLYLVKAGIWGENQNKPLYFLDGEDGFRVFSDNQNQGLVELNYEWR